jgi:ABC-type multidrug transport system ATPase subunit
MKTKIRAHPGKAGKTRGDDQVSVPPGTLLEARGVRKSYGRHEVLCGVDLAAGPGQLVGVVGENGAGKSTLLKILAGTMAADGGTVALAGTLGYCPQDPVLSDNLTVEAHLRYFAAAYRLPALDRADELVGQLGYARHRREPAGSLSGGTRQKLNLTLALMHDPGVLLLDEPYQGFDWETYLRFWDLVAGLRDRGKAVVIITHLVFEQDRFDLLADLSGGRLTARLAPEKEHHGHR